MKKRLIQLFLFTLTVTSSQAQLLYKIEGKDIQNPVISMARFTSCRKNNL